MTLPSNLGQREREELVTIYPLWWWLRSGLLEGFSAGAERSALLAVRLTIKSSLPLLALSYKREVPT